MCTSLFVTPEPTFLPSDSRTAIDDDATCGLLCVPSTYFPMQDIVVWVIGAIDHNPSHFNPLFLSKDIVLSKQSRPPAAAAADQIEFQTATETVCSTFRQCSSEIGANLQIGLAKRILLKFMVTSKYTFLFQGENILKDPPFELE